MGDTKEHLPSLVNGSYKVTGGWYSTVDVNGNAAIIHGNNGTSHSMEITLGNFGDSDPEITKSTGQKITNIELSYTYAENVTTMFGVVSNDGRRITFKSSVGITVLDWMTEEEAAALEEEGDPIDAPPGPYKIQPDNLGKFLWITGPPGLGKSTSAQLLAKSYGYVYYEGDCFSSCKNPYIPPDVVNPSLAQVNQKPLKGEGLEKRREVCKKTTQMFLQIFNGEEYDKELLKEFYTAMCEDIINERKRIGGDWAIASVAMNKDVRDIIRSVLGPDLVFVVLNMDPEDVHERLAARHKGHDSSIKMLMSIYKLCEAATLDEEQAINVVVTKEMSMEEVVNKILEMIN